MEFDLKKILHVSNHLSYIFVCYSYDTVFSFVSEIMDPINIVFAYIILSFPTTIEAAGLCLLTEIMCS